MDEQYISVMQPGDPEFTRFPGDTLPGPPATGNILKVVI